MIGRELVNGAAGVERTQAGQLEKGEDPWSAVEEAEATAASPAEPLTPNSAAQDMPK